MVYLDSAAVIKLIPAGPESPALRSGLDERTDAIHVGTAGRSGSALTFSVTHDQRPLDAAEATGPLSDSPAGR